MTFTINPGPIDLALEEAYIRLERCRFAEALRARRLDVWTDDPDVQQKIGARLGWVDSVDRMRPHLPRLRAFAHSIQQDGLTDVILLGMGGSSLAAEVLRASAGGVPGFPRFRVLDSVDPDAVRAAMEPSATALFVLASKSGSTIELTCLAAEAERRVRAAGVSDAGSRFIAITDARTVLHQRAIDQGFRDVFLNAPDIGGRYSALSFFGLVPAALMGIDLEGLLASADAMAGACSVDDPRRNPGLALGAVMAAAAKAGRDKLTLSLPGTLEPLGLWIEQLVAESTGKQGKGIIPITGATATTPTGQDCTIVNVVLRGDRPPVTTDGQGAAPVITLHVPDLASLGAEFFRWEVATAAAGLLLNINPFDEPNVQQAKDATGVLLNTYAAQGRLPIQEPDASIHRVRITLSATARNELEGQVPLAFLGLLRPGDYFGLLAFLPSDDARFGPILQHFRAAVGAQTGCATTLGFGPRYLHSTGQLHKGGPDTGVFVIVTAEPAADLDIPGSPYSFGVLETAEAVGDFQSLDRAGRRALHVHFPQRSPDLLQLLSDRLLRRA